MLLRIATINLLLCAAAGAQQQQPQQQSKAQPTFTATTRAVVVDVVATNGRGEVVTDLAASDFTVLEDNVPQKVESFSAERLKPQAELPPLPQHIYTNQTRYRRPDGPLTLVLIDFLNTPAEQGPFVRAEFLRFVRSGGLEKQRAAVLVLTSKLYVAQDLTRDAGALRAAAESLRSQTPAIRAEKDQAQIDAVRAGGGWEAEMLAERFEGIEAKMVSASLDRRVAVTLAAYRAIAHAVAGFSGRKNLLVISAGLPFSFTPESKTFREMRHYEDEIRETADLLRESQIAVYPIDARGLDVHGLSKSTTKTVADMRRSDRENFEDRAGRDFSMYEFADITGGRAFLHTNGLAAAMTATTKDGSAYYTLSYVPSRAEFDGRYRKIQVKAARPGVQLRHRHGYFAVDRGQAPAESADATFAAQEISATAVTFVARVLPPAPGAKVAVEFSVDTPTLTFVDENGNKRVNTEFVAMAMRDDGRPLIIARRPMRGAFPPETFARVQQEGIPYAIEMELPAGKYRLRLGVQDVPSGRIGTLDVPVTVPAK